MKKLNCLFRKPAKSLSLFSLLCLLLFTNMKCKKDSLEPGPETLPAETQTGARTYGCLVNGNIWLPTGKSLVPAISTTIQFDILTLKTNRSNENMVIGVYNMTTIGNYTLTNTNMADFSIGSITYSCISGSLEITKFDKTNKILSGRFSFIGKDNATSKTVSVTDGRFDVTFTN